MRKIWLLAIFILISSCGNKSTESALSPSHPNVTSKPPIATDQNQTDMDATDSIFETEEFKNSQKLIKNKLKSLNRRGYRMKKNEADGSYFWENYTHKNELSGVELQWQEGWFITKYRTKIGGLTHDIVTGEEVDAFSDEMTFYHTQPLYEFLSIKNWPKLEKYIGEPMDAIADHYNKYEGDLTEEMKADLVEKHSLVSSAYTNAKSHVEYLSLPVMTWEQILEKHEIKEIIWVSKNTNLFHASNAMIDSDRSEIRRLISDKQVRILKGTSPDQFDKLEKFKVYSNLFLFIQSSR